VICESSSPEGSPRRYPGLDGTRLSWRVVSVDAYRCRWLLDSLFELMAAAGRFPLATVHFPTTIELLTGDGVPRNRR
jgi:hypothetical protein